MIEELFYSTLWVVWVVFILLLKMGRFNEPWAQTEKDITPSVEYPIPPDGSTSYSSYCGRVILIEPLDTSHWGKSKGLLSKQIRIMMLVDNTQGFQFRLAPLRFRKAKTYNARKLFHVSTDTHNITETLFSSYTVSPKLLKSRSQTRQFSVELVNGRLYYTQNNARQKDVDRALDLLTEIADSLRI